MRPSWLAFACCCCCLLAAAAVAAAAAGAAGKAAGSSLLQCRTCAFYAKLRPYNDTGCVAGEESRLVQCPPQHACKLTVAQDAAGAFVHATRGCTKLNGDAAKKLAGGLRYTARTAMYCRRSGCNSNWRGDVGGGGGNEGAAAMRCWTGYGRHIDDFFLQPCSSVLLKLAATRPQQQLTCVLAQVTQSSMLSGRLLESVAYIGNCALLATSVYGDSYPIFEYQRECHADDCNRAGAVRRIGAVFLASKSAATVAGGRGAAAAAAVATVAAMAQWSLT